MKLNFKEWNIIYAALTERADRITNDIKWHDDWVKEHGGEDDAETAACRAELNDVTAIIKKLETSTI